MRRPAPVRRHAGFTLLEAIVAMVLISGAGMALFTWINQNISSLHRILETNARAEATSNVLEYMTRVNPMLTPEGSANLESYRVRWIAKQDGDPRDGNSLPFSINLYQFALYDTQVSVQRQGGQAWFDLKLRLLGYKKVRHLTRDF
jgi:general secretion pathway protein I